MKFRTLLIGAGVFAAGAYWMSLSRQERRVTEQKVAPYLPWWLGVLIGLRAREPEPQPRRVARRSGSSGAKTSGRSRTRRARGEAA